jgi:hypothetical protein
VHQIGKAVEMYERAFFGKIRNKFLFSMSAPVV